MMFEKGFFFLIMKWTKYGVNFQELCPGLWFTIVFWVKLLNAEITLLCKIWKNKPTH